MWFKQGEGAPGLHSDGDDSQGKVKRRKDRKVKKNASTREHHREESNLLLRQFCI
jgi:hypothetical protein